MNRIYPKDVMDLAFETHAAQKPGIGVTPADIAGAVMKDRTARLMRGAAIDTRYAKAPWPTIADVEGEFIPMPPRWPGYQGFTLGVDPAKPGSDQTVRHIASRRTNFDTIAHHNGETGEETSFVTLQQYETTLNEIAKVKIELGDAQRTVDALRNNMRHWHEKFCQEKDRADETGRKHKAVKAEYAEFVKQHEREVKEIKAKRHLKPGTENVCAVMVTGISTPKTLAIQFYPRDAILRVILSDDGRVHGTWDGDIRSGLYGALVDAERENDNG